MNQLRPSTATAARRNALTLVTLLVAAALAAPAALAASTEAPTKPTPAASDDLGPTAAPAHDAFEHAVEVALPGSVHVSTAGATTEDGEPAFCAPIGATLWYRFSLAEEASVDLDTFDSGFDTVLAVYTGSWGALAHVACNDDTNSLQSRVAFNALAGTTYYVQVGGFGGDTGELQLNGRTGTPFVTPANDDRANAETLDVSGPMQTQSTRYATLEAGEANPCAPIGATVWFTFTAPSSDSLELDTAGSSFDTVMGLYDADLNQLACNDDDYSLQARIRYDVVAGDTYYVQVGGYGDASGDLVLDADLLTRPANDDFADATPIEEAPATHQQDTREATLEDAEPTPCGAIRATVWYAWTPETATLATVDTFGSNFDTVLAVYASTSEGLVNLDCNDDGATLQSSVSFPAVPGVTYYVQVGGYVGEQGDLVLNLATATDGLL